MKKLLSILGAMTLIGTASTSVIACGEEKPTPPSPDTRTDIENKITSPIALGQLSENTKTDFLAKLQIALTQIPNLNTITASDYDVYKAGTTIEIQDSDITVGNFLNIKIVAKGSKFQGNKDNITTNYTRKDTRTDIENKITSPIALGQLSENTKTDFLAKLQIALTQIPNLNTITASDYDVYKAGTTIEIQDSDITVGNFLNIKIVAKGSKFQGNKDNITTNYTRKDTRTDIENKITSPIALGQLSENTKTDFLAKLQIALTQIPNLNTITASDYDVYKAGTTIEIQDSDITVGNFLNIKIVAKGSKFQGNKDNITTNYTRKDTRTDIENKITSPIALGQLSENTKTDFLAKLQIALTQIPNLNTITASDYDVYKAGTTIEIQDSDITVGNFLNIKIVAKGSKFQGNKDNITTNYTRKDTRTDIENKITSPIALGQLSENTKTDFLAKLQTALTQIPNLNTITASDYDVYKAGTTIEIQDSDITLGNFLNIKIVAKGSKFQGNKDNITTNYTRKDTRTDIENKITSPIALGQLSENTKTDFLAKLQTALTQIPNLNTITASDYDVYKAGTTIEIQDSDITVGNFLNIKIVAKGSKFQGNKDNITTNYTRKDTRTDIENKITSLIDLGQLSENTKTDFLAKLQIALTQIPNLNTITASDYDVYKAGTTIEIQDSDITVGNFLNIKIVAKGSKFQGTADNITTITSSIEKIDLTKIIQVTEFNFAATTNEKNNNDKLWSLIFEAPELKKYKNLIQSNGNWYKEVFSQSDKNIIDDFQKPGIIYLVVNTTKNNLYCNGKTKKIKVTLN